MKDYLAMVTNDERGDLQHRLARDFVESSVKRDGNGMFAKKAGSKWKPSEDDLGKITEAIMNQPGFRKAYDEAWTQAVASAGLPSDWSSLQFTEEESAAIDTSLATNLAPYFNEQAKSVGTSPDGTERVEYYVDSDGNSGQRVVPNDDEAKHSDDIPDYIGARSFEPGDKVDFGIKGMKWGVRRSDSQIEAATQKRAAQGEEVTATKKAAEVTSGKGSSGPESSQARYARLQSQAKSGKASDMDEADLKFFNSRTEALSKVAKMNEEKPGWLSETAKKVVRTTAERQLQSVADSIANKYISDRVAEGLKKAAK